jgi:ABC-type polysaccharide/polyol phosphate transport system ATPase subunit
MSQTAGRVRVQDLWEKFRIYHSRPRGLKERLFRLERSYFEDFWALQGVTFQLEAGESLAVVGANGSGKSTLLKCLARILPPDRGEVNVEGRVASLLELGAGFHGDLSGRENVFLNGSILGMRRQDLARVFDQIVSFAGVEEFIDTPVRNYSSGMFVRLGFAIAVNVDPDILLIDEILAVGDAAFQTQCFERMHEFKREGKTLLLVTHDLDAATRLCDKAVLLDKGLIEAEGSAREVVSMYRQRIVAEHGDQPVAPNVPSAGKRWGTGEAEIVSTELLDEDERPVDSLKSSSWSTFRLKVRFSKDTEDPVFGYIVRADDGTELFAANTMWRGITTGLFRAGEIAEIRFRQRIGLLPSKYLLTTAIAHRDGNQWYDWWDDCLMFRVVGPEADKGYADLEAEFSLRVIPQSDGA